MLKINDDLCTGCSLCSIICPEKAIDMEISEEGFAVPHVKKSLCNDCDKCNNSCPIMCESKINTESKEKKVYACQAVDKMLLIEATAGGLFPVLATEVIRHGGVVYGAAYDSTMKVVHKAATSVEELKQFNGSKYVQSDITNALVEIQDYLKAGKTVLFSGTPCQVDAAKTISGTTDNGCLITMDVICYGVPSPALFQAFIATMEKRMKAKVIDFRFRDKHKYGWSHTTVITYRDQNGQVFSETEPNYANIPYYKMFGYRDCYRKSCYYCKYNNLDRCSDITTGNYWGIENNSTAFKSNLGVSMAICNTEKGKTLLTDVKDKLILEEHTLEEVVLANDALIKGSTLPKRREQIYKCFIKKGFEKTYNKYYAETVYRKTRMRLSAFLQKVKQVF